MSKLVTLDVSEEIARRAREAARRTGRPFEDVLADWLERGASDDRRVESVTGVPQEDRGGYPVFTPYGNEAAAEVLLEALRASEDGAADTRAQ